MFDNFLDKLKNQANYISNNIKYQKHKFSHLETFKNPFKLNKNDYKSVSQGEEMQYMSPRAYTETDNTKWPTIVNHNVEWFPYVPRGEDNSVVDKFVRIITINDESNNYNVIKTWFIFHMIY